MLGNSWRSLKVLVDLKLLNRIFWNLWKSSEIAEVGPYIFSGTHGSISSVELISQP